MSLTYTQTQHRATALSSADTTHSRTWVGLGGEGFGMNGIRGVRRSIGPGLIDPFEFGAGSIGP